MTLKGSNLDKISTQCTISIDNTVAASQCLPDLAMDEV